METVEVMIKLPKDMYERTLCTGVVIVGIDAAFIGGAISDGTVLPKGHGDLKDAAEIERLWQKGDYDSLVSALIFAPTVIKADEEKTEEVEND